MSQQSTILIVEDHQVYRTLLAKALEQEGFHCLIAENGRYALKILDENPVDLVILDLLMPEMDGFELLEVIRDTPYEPVPILVFSGRHSSKEQIRALELGASDFVVKPVEFKLLLARIKNLLRLHTSSKNASLTHDLKPGDVVAGRYQLLEMLGYGSSSLVFRARHMELQIDVALKLLRFPADSTVKVARERFRREARALMHLSHPNAVRIFDFGVSSTGHTYLAMELLEGCNLEELLEEKGRLSISDSLGVMMGVTSVLYRIHEMGFVHRDIKPSNIFLAKVNGQPVVKLLDFGIVFDRDATELESVTMDNIVMGTPAYIAPERLRNHPYDGRADTYSLGAVFFEMLAGEPPFTSKNGDLLQLLNMHLFQAPPILREKCPGIPMELQKLVSALLTKDPEQRPNALSALQCLQDICELQANQELHPEFATQDALLSGNQ